MDASLDQLGLFWNLLVGELACMLLEKLDPFIQAEIHYLASRLQDPKSVIDGCMGQGPSSSWPGPLRVELASPYAH